MGVIVVAVWVVVVFLVGSHVAVSFEPCPCVIFHVEYYGPDRRLSKTPRTASPPT